MKQHTKLKWSKGKKIRENPTGLAKPGALDWPKNTFGDRAARKARKICNKLSDAEMRQHCDEALEIIYGRRRKKRTRP